MKQSEKDGVSARTQPAAGACVSAAVLPGVRAGQRDCVEVAKEMPDRGRKLRPLPLDRPPQRLALAAHLFFGQDFRPHQVAPAHRQSETILQAGLLENVHQVDFHRSRRDVQVFGDLFVAQSAAD